MKRLFCAVKVPLTPAIGEVLEVFRQELRHEDIKWVDPGNLHITLKFFGETPMRDVAPIAQALQLAAADSAPFSFRVEGCGTFGPDRQPRVIWLGIRDAKPLIQLSERVHHHLYPLGFEPEKRVFSPHLTIGRIRQIRDLATLNALEGDFSEEHFATVEAGSFYLYESILKPGGPQYRIEQAFTLGEGHRA